ncbi:anti-sigma factor antagonist [Kribbella pittospori]|uniref:Anti-sigma factor antagonist n=1 Tax=Kribbella pittospori TaxID=722689 RepID=A0A4R0JVE9_9ACTN|nr:STAS domain-containing protein [Kribbella pittospori]TCC51461.1 anti-sigma factor antagonist [Kribbella pittospori]
MNATPPQQGQGWFAATPFDAEREAIGRGVYVLRLSGDLDLGSYEMAFEAVREKIGPTARTVLLDLSGVTFCSSSGLRVLVAAAEHAATQNIELGLVGAGRSVLRPMEIAGIDAHFRSYPTIAAALADGIPSSGDSTDS